LKDANLHGLKGAMLQSYDGRKKRFLPLSIEIFNRLTEKTFTEPKKLTIKESANAVDQNIETFETLLNDSRSPIVSNLKNTAKYADYPVLETFEQWNDVRTEKEVVDYTTAERDAERIGRHRVQIYNIIIQIRNHLEHMSEERDNKNDLSELY